MLSKDRFKIFFLFSWSSLLFHFVYTMHLLMLIRLLFFLNKKWLTLKSVLFRLSALLITKKIWKNEVDKFKEQKYETEKKTLMSPFEMRIFVIFSLKSITVKIKLLFCFVLIWTKKRISFRKSKQDIDGEIQLKKTTSRELKSRYHSLLLFLTAKLELKNCLIKSEYKTNLDITSPRALLYE